MGRIRTVLGATTVIKSLLLLRVIAAAAGVPTVHTVDHEVLSESSYRVLTYKVSTVVTRLGH